MRRQLNFIFRPLGYELIRKKPHLTWLERRARQAGRLRFVQIGANDGVRFDDLYRFATSHTASGLVVEPISIYFERLSLNYHDYPAIVPVRAALHPTLDQATMYYVDPAKAGDLPDWTAGIASLDATHHQRSGVNSEQMISEIVPCKPLMTLLKEYGIDELDYLQVDAEGFDAEVIRMIDFETIRPAWIRFERTHLSEGDREDVRVRLKSAGYRVRSRGTGTDAVAY